jgi:alpha,alpha-trehalase
VATPFVTLFSSLFALQKIQRYTKIAQDYQAAIDDVLWNEKEGIWLDYDIKNRKHRNAFYVSNLMPLYTMSYNRVNKLDYALKAVSYLERNKIYSFYGKHVPRSISFRLISTSFEFVLQV